MNKKFDDENIDSSSKYEKKVKVRDSCAFCFNEA